MADYGLGPKGFKRKQYAEIMNEMESRARMLFGESINLTERSPLGLFIRIIAWFTGVIWQLAEKVYYSSFVDTAEGTSLDYVCKYVGIVRRPAERGQGEVTFYGESGTVIPEGTLVATENGVTYRTVQEATVAESETVVVPVACLETGTVGNTPSYTVVEIVTPLADIEAVTNEQKISGGREQETDHELRERYLNSISKGGASTIDSIRAELLSVPGVRAVHVAENNEMEPDEDGRPPKSIECFVLGGQAEQIARAILNTKAAGIQAFGQEVQQIEDQAGHLQTVGFSYAAEKTVYVNIDVTTSAKFPANGKQRLRSNVIKYIGGHDEDGNVYSGLSMGQEVVLSRIISACYQVEGVEDVTVELSFDGETYTAANLPISIHEVAETDWQKVVVQ